MTEICGTTPDASVLSRKMSAYPPERDDAFLNARAAGVVEPDHRRSDLHRHFHDFADFFGVRFRQRAAEDGEILREDEHHPAMDLAATGDDPVTKDILLVQTEVGRPVGDEHIEFFEGIRVDQQLDPFARGQLPFFVLSVDPVLSAAQFRFGPHRFKMVQFLFQRHEVPQRCA